jgi:transposase InsO family protein
VKRLNEGTPAWSVAALCDVLSVPRSSFYYRPRRRDEAPLRAAVSETAGQWPRYGSERVAAQMRRQGLAFHGGPVGERRTRRLMREMGLLAKPKPRKVRTTDSGHTLPRFPNLVKGLTVTRPDQVWVSDITYIALGSGFAYLSVVMDVFTRSIRGWHLSRGLNGDLTLNALKQAVRAATPEVHHSDQGVQYAAKEYVRLLQSRGVSVSMAAVGCPEENGFAERLMRTIKEEHVSLSEYHDLVDARAQIGRFLTDVYQTKRIHSALGYLTPAEFETAYRTTQAAEPSAE